MKLWTTSEYDKLTWAEITRIANGCGPSTCRHCAKFLDNALGLFVFEACVQHDIDYNRGGTKRDKQEGDIRFICNLLIIALEKRSLWNVIRVPYLFLYYLTVSLGGKAHFNWKDNDNDNDNGGTHSSG